MKTVIDLDAKPKYRKWVWLDSLSGLWFWSADHQAWYTLGPYSDGWWIADSVDLGDDTPWPEAPFTRLVKNGYYNGASVWYGS